MKKKKKKSSKQKYIIGFVIFMLLIDLSIMIFLASVPYIHFQTNDILQTKNYIQNHLNLFHYYSLILQHKEIQITWLVLQGFILAFCIYTSLKLTTLINPKKSFSVLNTPESAGNEHGTAEWATEDELNSTATKIDLDEDIQKGGILIGTNLKNNEVWIETSDTHSNIIGVTRSGKTRKLVLPTIEILSRAGESMILTDPKGELYIKTKDLLKAKGYTVNVINFRDPSWSNHWNPLQIIIEQLEQKNTTKAAQLAQTLAHTFVHQFPDSKKGDQVWNNGAESVLTALILYIAIEAPKNDQKHLTSVLRTLGELGQEQEYMVGNLIRTFVPLNELFKKLPYDHPAKDAFMTARLSTEKMRGSFFSQITTLLRNFTDPAIQFLTSKNDVDLKQPGLEKTATFLIIPDEDKTRHVLATIFVEQTYQALVEVANANNGRLPIRVNNLLDEFGNMPPFKDFDTKLTVSGGRGIRWHIFVQDNQQIETMYPGAAETIKGNCQTWIYILTASIKTAEEISKRLGTYTIRSEGSGVSENKTISRSANFGKMKRSLLTSDELMKIPFDKAIVMRLRQNPIYITMPDISEYPFYHLFKDDNKIDFVINEIQKINYFIPNDEGNSETEDYTHKLISEESEVEEEEEFNGQPFIFNLIKPGEETEDISTSEDEKLEVNNKLSEDEVNEKNDQSNDEEEKPKFSWNQW